MKEVYYGFSDQVLTDSGGKMHIRFDSVSEDDINNASSIDKIIEKDSIIIDITVEKEKIHEYILDLPKRKRIENRWFKISRNGDDLNAIFHNCNRAQNIPENIKICNPRYLAPTEDIFKKILKIFKCPDQKTIPKALENEISITSDPACVKCVNVGQGNCNIILNEEGCPLYYYDFGCRIGRDAKSYPINDDFCFPSTAFVVLSHWHLDHFINFKKHPDVLKLKWIVPPLGQYSIGKTHLELIYNLMENNNLFLLDNQRQRLNTKHFEILSLKKWGTNKNNSGLVMFIKLPHEGSFNVLLPGDASYKHIPLGFNLNGLVASHHGGRTCKNDKFPSACPTRNIIAYSYGKDNIYKHPIQKVVENLENAGWRNRYDTLVNGDIYIPQGTNAEKNHKVIKVYKQI